MEYLESFLRRQDLELYGPELGKGDVIYDQRLDEVLAPSKLKPKKQDKKISSLQNHHRAHLLNLYSDLLEEFTEWQLVAKKLGIDEEEMNEAFWHEDYPNSSLHAL